MKKIIIASLLAFATTFAFACKTPSCSPVTVTSSNSSSLSVQGTISNQIVSEAVATAGQNKFSTAQASAGVTETAKAFGTTSAAFCATCGPSAGIAGNVSTNGTAFTTTSGTGTFGAVSAANGSADAALNTTVTAKQGGSTVTLTGGATAGNVLGIGSASGSLAGSNQTSGGALATASSFSGFLASGSVLNCLKGTITGTITDTKFGGAQAAVVTTGGGFANLAGGVGGAAFQNATITGSFFGKK